jgi:hypothetical protein
MMIEDIRLALLIVALIGVCLNLVMVARLNRDIRLARLLVLLDEDKALAISARRWQSLGLLAILVCLSASAFYEAGSGWARLLVFVAVIIADVKSIKLYKDRFDADVLVAKRLKREKENNHKP